MAFVSIAWVHKRAHSQNCYGVFQVLQLELKESRAFTVVKRSPVHLYADARGHPARIAAVLLIDGEVWYTDCEPPKEMLEILTERHDDQIMGLELFSVSLGLSTFVDKLAGRDVFVWSDNRGLFPFLAFVA